jgi:hypothetical protein
MEPVRQTSIHYATESEGELYCGGNFRAAEKEKRGTRGNQETEGAETFAFRGFSIAPREIEAHVEKEEKNGTGGIKKKSEKT